MWNAFCLLTLWSQFKRLCEIVDTGFIHPVSCPGFSDLSVHVLSTPIGRCSPTWFPNHLSVLPTLVASHLHWNWFLKKNYLVYSESGSGGNGIFFAVLPVMRFKTTHISILSVKGICVLSAIRKMCNVGLAAWIKEWKTLRL